MNASRTSRRAAAFAAPAVTLAAALVAAGAARAQSITPAPAFNAERLRVPAFRASYTDQELRDLAAYVAARLAAAND